MNKEQVNVAERELCQWLAHPMELGRIPAKIQCTGLVVYGGLLYYTFKFKKTFFGPWLLGYAGGFEGNDLRAEGQPFSQMQPYVAKTAQEECIKMLDRISNYWKQRAEMTKE